MAFTQNTHLKTHYILSEKSRSIDLIDFEHDQKVKEREERNRSLMRPKLLLIHGLFFGNLAGWYPLISQKLSSTYDILCYDLRGHGLSQVTPKGYHLTQLLDDLCALLSELGWLNHTISIAGHSFGGRLGFELLVSQRVNVDQLILIDSPLSSREEKQILGLDQSFYDDHQTTDRPLEALWSILPTEVKFLLEQGGRRATRALQRWFSLLHETSLIDDLAQIPEVTFDQLSNHAEQLRALYGGRSGCLSSWKILAPLLAPEHGKLIDDGGHFLLNESPLLVEEFICEMLRINEELS